MPSILVATGFVRIDSDTAPALKALKAFGAVGSTALTTALLPATAAVTTGVLAIGNAAVSAGAALGALGVAVIPQFKAITEASQKLKTAEDAETKATVAKRDAQRLAKDMGVQYGKEIKLTSDMSDAARARAEEYNTALRASESATKAADKSQALYKESLAAMSPATRDTALAMEGLKNDVDNWSKAMSGTTMPIFTRGIEILRAALPKLTPFVKIASNEISLFLKSFGGGQAGAVFREFGKNISDNAGSSLRNFLKTVRNLTVGFVGVLNAFAPFQSKVSGGLAELSGKFANWGATLQSNKGFQTFIRTAQEGAPRLGELLSAIGQAFVEITKAAGPMAGVGIKVATVFAQIISAIPTPVLRVLIPAIIATNLAFKLYAVYTAAATAATWLFGTSVTTTTGFVYSSRAVMIAHRAMLLASAAATGVVTAATWLWSAALSANPIGIVILALVALGAGLVVAYKKFEGFRNVVNAVFNWIKDHWKLVLVLITGPIGGAVLLVVKYWDQISGAAKAVFNWVRDHWKLVLGFITGPVGAAVLLVVTHWGKISKAFTDAWGVIWRNVLSPLKTFFTKTLPDAAKGGRDIVVAAFRFLALKVLDAFGLIISGAAKLFGWVPGVGGKLKKAKSAFDTFRNDVNKALGGIDNKSVTAKLDYVTYKGKSISVYSAGRLASGGPVNGPGSGTSDSVPIMASDGEHMWTAREVDAVGGHEGVMRIRAAALSGAFRGYATGGQIGVGKVNKPSYKTVDSLTTRTHRAVVQDNIKHIYNKIWDAIMPSVLASIPGGSGVTRWTSVVQSMLRALGQPLSYTGLTLRRMNQESGGNPRAVNKWDINWQRGYPSVGLMQVIRPTFQANAGRYRNTGPFMYGVSIQPAANIYASMRYALRAYGSLPAAYNRAGGYDNGGWLLPGWTAAYNGTGRPERVLSPRQDEGSTIVIERLVLENNGVIGSRYELENWLVTTLTTLKRKGRI